MGSHSHVILSLSLSAFFRPLSLPPSLSVCLYAPFSLYLSHFLSLSLLSVVPFCYHVPRLPCLFFLTQMNRRSTLPSSLLLLLLLCAPPLAPADRPNPSCPARTHYVTKYSTKTQEIPVYETSFITETVTATLRTTEFQTKLKKQFTTEFTPKQVTKTLNLLYYVTDTIYTTHYSTSHVTQYVTQTLLSPQYVKETHYDSLHVTSTQLHYERQFEISTRYLTQTSLSFSTAVVSTVVPRHETLVQTLRRYVTSCAYEG